MMKAREFLEQESLSGKEPAEGAETSITGEADMSWDLALCMPLQHFCAYQLQSQHLRVRQHFLFGEAAVTWHYLP